MEVGKGGEHVKGSTRPSGGGGGGKGPRRRLRSEENKRRRRRGRVEEGEGGGGGRRGGRWGDGKKSGIRTTRTVGKDGREKRIRSWMMVWQEKRGPLQKGGQGPL